MLSYFHQLAQSTLCSMQLQVDSPIHGLVKLDLVELEVYYQSEDHADPFVHGHLDQLTNNCWYFHKQARSYRAGTYKGLDITFGDSSCYGGLLIRSVAFNNRLIEGPCRTVNLLLELLGIERIDQLVAFDEPALNVTHERLKLISRTESLVAEVIRGPRVGLSLKSAEATDNCWWYYHQLPYRFVVQRYLGQIKKQRFLLSLPERWIRDRYKLWFEAGQAMSLSDFPVKVTRVQELCELYGCWWTAHMS